MSQADQDPTLAARRLPRSIQPDRDLWPEIAARLAEPAPERAAAVSQSGSAPRRWQARSMASAGMAAGVLAAGVILWVAVGTSPSVRNDSAGESGPAGTLPGTVPVSLGAPPELLETRAALVARLHGQLAALPPETRTVVVTNLNTINKALDEIDRALEDSPDSRLSRRLLMSMYADQLTMLTEMNVLIRRANQQETAL